HSLRNTAPSAVCALSLHDALPISLAGCGPLYLSYFSMTILSSRTADTKRYGPEPTGSASNALASAPAIFFGTIRTTAIREGNRRSEEHTSELQSRENLVCRLLLEK